MTELGFGDPWMAIVRCGVGVENTDADVARSDVITLHNAAHVPPGVPTLEQVGRNQAAVATPANLGTASRAVSQPWAISTAGPGGR